LESDRKGSLSPTGQSLGNDLDAGERTAINSPPAECVPNFNGATIVRQTMI
jgi:hypothetical protein